MVFGEIGLITMMNEKEKVPSGSGRIRVKKLSISDLQRSKMVRQSVNQGAMFGLRLEEKKFSNAQFSSCTDEEDQKDEDAEAGTAESLLMPEIRKRNLPRPEAARPIRRGRQRQTNIYTKPKAKKLENSVERWSAERYKQAEQSLLEIMKAEGAVFGKPISRPQLRVAGRKRIGDTGLLDHLLKHIDGKVAPGGAERFRRWHNTNGVMEYWLENADLVNIRQEAGVQDPFWVPPSWWKPGSAPQEPATAADLALLKEEMTTVKRYLEELIGKKQDKDQANLMEDTFKELVNWKYKSDQHMIEISSSLTGVQDMYRDLMAWKAKTELQLTEVSNTLSSMQAMKQCNAGLSPPEGERWEDWLNNANMEGMQGDDLDPWLDGFEPKVERDLAVHNPYPSLPNRLKSGEGAVQDPAVARELEMLKEEMTKIKRDVQELASRKQDESSCKGLKDCSVAPNSKADLDNNSLLLLHEMFKELAKWRTKMEKQLMDVSNAVNSMQSTKQLASRNPSTFYL